MLTHARPVCDLGALADSAVVRLFEAATAAPRDTLLVSLINDALQPYRVAKAIHPDALRPYPGPDSGLDMGDIKLGVVHETGLRWRIPAGQVSHLLVLGLTGGETGCGGGGPRRV